MQLGLATPTLVVVLSLLISSALAASASPAQSSKSPKYKVRVSKQKQCSAAQDFCGVHHDGEFFQYRECCGALECTAYDRLTTARGATDVWQKECWGNTTQGVRRAAHTVTEQEYLVHGSTQSSKRCWRANEIEGG
ncbi:hypothetical protein C8R46DRAFT_1193055 [Mycena filopes]|nr:hypothetical protein C8R46DRAFT_1193055 [Mycena filopes]